MKPDEKPRAFVRPEVPGTQAGAPALRSGKGQTGSVELSAALRPH